MKKLFTYVSLVIFSALVIAACTGKYRDEVQKPDTLYSRLGGDSSIRLISDKFVEYVALDTAINDFFESTIRNKRTDALKMNIANLIIEMGGGPELYTGKDMYSAHIDMDIENRHFDAFLEDLNRAMEYYNVHQNEKEELVKLFSRFRSQIVKQP